MENKSLIRNEKLLPLDVISQVQITRSFSRKIQLEQYEPIEVFASVQATLIEGLSEDEVVRVSKELDAFVKDEVARDIAQYERLKPPF